MPPSDEERPRASQRGAFNEQQQLSNFESKEGSTMSESQTFDIDSEFKTAHISLPHVEKPRYGGVIAEVRTLDLVPTEDGPCPEKFVLVYAQPTDGVLWAASKDNGWSVHEFTMKGRAPFEVAWNGVRPVTGGRTLGVRELEVAERYGEVAWRVRDARVLLAEAKTVCEPDDDEEEEF